MAEKKFYDNPPIYGDEDLPYPDEYVPVVENEEQFYPDERQKSAGKLFRERLHGLNAEQRRAALETGKGKWLVVAGPGSGKTMTMTVREANLVGRGMDPSRMCMMTFTVKSAEEMRRRATMLNPDCENILSGTIHSVALRILRDAAYGNERKWHVIDDDEAASLFVNVCRSRFLDQSEAKMPVTPSEVKRFFRNCRNERMNEKERKEKFLYRHYASWKGETEDDRKYLKLMAAVKTGRHILSEEENTFVIQHRHETADPYIYIEWLLTSGNLEHELERFREAVKPVGLPKKSLLAPYVQEGKKAEKKKEEKKEKFTQKWMAERLEADLRAFKIMSEAYQDFLYEKRSRGQLEMDDIVSEACRLLNEHEELREYFLDVAVDEFQDTSEDQSRFIRLLSEKASLFCVGDDCQSIYGWRNARIENFYEMENAVGRNHVLRLQQNYRSNQSVVDRINTCQKKLVRSRIEREIVSFSGKRVTQPRLGRFPTAKSEASGICNAILQAHAQGIPWKEIAVLFRSHKSPLCSSHNLQRELMDCGVPFRVVGGNVITDMPETKFAMRVLRLLVNPFEQELWDNLLVILPSVGEMAAAECSRHIYEMYRDMKAENTRKIHEIQEGKLDFDTVTLTEPSIADAAEYIRNNLKVRAKDDKLKDFEQSRDAFLDMLCNVEKNAQSMRHEEGGTIETLLNDIEQVLLSDFALKKLFDISYNTSKAEASDKVEEIKNNIAYLKSLGKEKTNLDAFIETFYTDRRERTEDNDCVTLSTVHSAKGLEWRVVFAASVNEGVFPPRPKPCPNGTLEEMKKYENSTKRRMEEEARLFFVDLSRAKEWLFISSFMENFEGEKVNPSPFFTELAKEEYGDETPLSQMYLAQGTGFGCLSFNDDEPDPTKDWRIGADTAAPRIDDVPF